MTLKRFKMKHTEQSIIKELHYRFPRRNVEFKLHNCFIFAWESDFFFITKSGYAVEIEIKISKADFKKDSEKVDKHMILKEGKRVTESKTGTLVGKEWIYTPKITEHECKFRPNQFYYCCPDGMITADQLPPYAGLIYISDNRGGSGVNIVKKAPYIHKEKLNFYQILCEKFYNKYMDLKSEFNYYTQNTILRNDY